MNTEEEIVSDAEETDGDCGESCAPSKRNVKKFIVKLTVSLFVIAAAVVGLYFLLRHFGLTDISQEQIRAYLDGMGVWAPLVYILISFLQVTFIPIPGAITIVAGYYFFGAFEAFIYSYIGMMLGSLLAYFLGRWIGRPFVNWLAGGSDKVDYWLRKLRGRENLLLFFMFFLPIFPDDLLCSVAGMIPQKPLVFIVMQLTTRITSISVTILTTTIAMQGWPFIVAIAVGIALLIPVFVYCYKNIEKVSAFFSRIGRKIVHKKEK